MSGLDEQSDAAKPVATKSIPYRLVQLGDGAFDLMQEPQTITFKSESHRKQFMDNLKKGNGGIDLPTTNPEANKRQEEAQS